MKVLVTGSAGHLGEALLRVLSGQGHDVRGLDVLASQFTSDVGSICDRETVSRCVDGVDAVLHAATLHKPHVETHTLQDFVDVNISGTLALLEAVVAARVGAFVFTSTTSVFGDAMAPAPGAPAVWVSEDIEPRPKNIYGVTKLAAENLCALMHRLHGLPALVLRTSRFFPEEDDQRAIRDGYDGDNAKLNELLNRRVEIEDAVDAHLCAIERAGEIGFGRYIVSATTPFSRDDLGALREDAPGVVERRVPGAGAIYAHRGWRMFPSIERVYVNQRARDDLGWRPRHDFVSALAQAGRGEAFGSALAREVGAKGYHAETFADGPYPVEGAREVC